MQLFNFLVSFSWFFFQVLKCEYAVRGEIVTHAQVLSEILVCYMYLVSFLMHWTTEN
jgi:hypothetical protein